MHLDELITHLLRLKRDRFPNESPSVLFVRLSRVSSGRRREPFYHLTRQIAVRQFGGLDDDQRVMITDFDAREFDGFRFISVDLED